MEDIVSTTVMADLSTAMHPNDEWTGNDADHDMEPTASSMRDGPAEDAEEVAPEFDPSSIPMLTTSPSKHGSNLTSYIDVCHSWIDAELQPPPDTKAAAPAMNTTPTLEALSPVPRYEPEGRHGGGVLTDEEGEYTETSLLNCSSDSSTGPPPPPPPLVPWLESDTAVRTSFAAPRMLVDGVTPFDEVTEATNECDTTLDTLTLPADGTAVVVMEVTKESMYDTGATGDTIQLDATEPDSVVVNTESKTTADAPTVTRIIQANQREVTTTVEHDDVVREEIDPAPEEEEEDVDIAAYKVEVVREDIDAVPEEEEDVDLAAYKVHTTNHLIAAVEDIDDSETLHWNCTPEEEIAKTPEEEEDVDVFAYKVDTTNHCIVAEEDNDDSKPLTCMPKKEITTTIVVLENNEEIENVIAPVPSKTEHAEQEPKPFDEITEEPQDKMDTTIDTVTLLDGTDIATFGVKDVMIEGMSDELLMVEPTLDAAFVGDVESPHDKDVAHTTEVPFLGNIMSPSADREYKYPLDEDILDMSPEELNVYVQQVKTTSDSVANDGLMAPTSIIPNDVLPVAGEFEMPVESNEMQVRHVDLNADMVDGATNGVLVGPELHSISVAPIVAPPTEESTKCNTATSPKENIDLVPNSRITEIHEELENIEQMIENPPKFDLVDDTDATGDFDVIGKEEKKKKPLSESDIFFEQLWKEPTTESTAPIGAENCGTEIVNNQTAATSPNVRGAKTHVVSGNMDFLSTRKGSAYVDYAKRSAQKIQKFKEDILSGDELEMTATLSHAGGDIAHGEADQSVFVDVSNTDDIAAPPISPGSENEIVRVPTSEEAKSTPPKSETVATSCMDVCVVM